MSPPAQPQAEHSEMGPLTEPSPGPEWWRTLSRVATTVGSLPCVITTVRGRALFSLGSFEICTQSGCGDWRRRMHVWVGKDEIRTSRSAHLYLDSYFGDVTCGPAF